jgi:hypothetical protein
MNFSNQLKATVVCALAIGLNPPAAEAGDGVTVTVGGDGACDYASITAAVFNAPAANVLVIELAKNVSIGSTQLVNTRNTLITGGFDDCSDTTASGTSILDGSGFNGSILLGTNSGTSTIDLFLENVEITGGNTNTNGGGISLQGPWRLVMAGANINDNVANGNGGGIYMSDPNAMRQRGFTPTPRSSLEIYENSLVSSNTAQDGGGIACVGDVGIEVFDSQIGTNEATSDGGGVFLTDGCQFELNDSGPFQGVLLNEAAGFGGGIFAEQGSQVRLRGGDSDGSPAVVVSNSASNGGGIALRTSAVLDARDSVITSNSASSTGGGIRSDDSEIHIYRSQPGGQCHSADRCSVLSDNSAGGTDPGFAGGGGILAFGGSLRITGTYMEDNQANFGSAIRARFIPLNGLSRDITILGSVFAGNSGAAQVIYLDESDADIGFSTFVDNLNNDRVIEIAYPDTPGGPHETRIFGSIFDQAGNTVASAELTTAGQFPAADCNRNEANSTGDLAGGSRSTSALPAFVDRNAGGFGLLPTSAMIDYCDWSTLGSLSNHSANGLNRPNDVPAVNLHGAWDLGGIEYYPVGAIFSDRFEG